MGENIKQKLKFNKWAYPSLLMFMFLACGLFIFVLPLITVPAGQWIKAVFLTIIVMIASTVVGPTIKLRALALISIIFLWINHFTDFILLQYFGEFLINLFSFWVVIRFVLQIMKRNQVSLYTLVEALLGYLLLGIIFTSIVSFIDFHVPNAYSAGLSTDLDRSYYTLITLTTTGYGDITPISPIAKSLSLVISICGQFYVAVIVAIIVGKFSNQLTK